MTSYCPYDRAGSKKIQIIAFIDRHDDQMDLVGGPLAGATLPGTHKGSPKGLTFCGNIYRVYTKIRNFVNPL